MKYSDLNRGLADIFTGGSLPSLVYIDKQLHSRKTLRRPWHRHDSICELLLITDGQGVYHVKNKSYNLQVGDVILYNQGDLHELETTSKSEIGCYCLGITNLRIQGLPYNHLVSAGDPFVRHSSYLYATLNSLCSQIYELEGSGTEADLSAQLLCSAVIILACGLETLPSTFIKKHQEEKMVLDIQKYMDEHFREDLTLDKIAADLNCSVTHISHSFKKATATTPMQYLIDRRIGHAQTLLISTDHPVTQIATLSGYDNINYFSTQFSRIVGMSPAKYRELYRKEAKGRKDQS